MHLQLRQNKIPVLDYLGVKPSLVSLISDVGVLQTGDEVKITVPATVPATEDLLKVLADTEVSWWRAFATSKFAVQHTSYIASPLRHILAPSAGRKLTI
jgi:hypothetical protein